MHVAEVLDGKRRVAVVLGRARCQHTRAECPRLADQRGLVRIQPEGSGIEDGCGGLMLVEIA